MGGAQDTSVFGTREQRGNQEKRVSEILGKKVFGFAHQLVYGIHRFLIGVYEECDVPRCDWLIHPVIMQRMPLDACGFYRQTPRQYGP
jgi:hypothetical protein